MAVFRSFTKRQRRKRVYVASLISTTLLLLCTLYLRNSDTSADRLISSLLYDGNDSYMAAQRSMAKFYDRVFDTIVSSSPKSSVHPLIRGESCADGQLKVLGVNDDKNFYSKEYLADCIQLEEEKYTELKISHEKVVSLLPQQFPQGYYHGDGIVMVGGGKFSFLAVLSIKTMRYRGTTLPVEVFIPDGEEEDEKLFCGSLTKLNARCIHLSDIASAKTLKQLDIKGYQLKSLALMASSFENVLLLDADNTAVHKIDDIFRSAPFNETGLVTWPDYWKRATSPIFYDVAGVALGERVRNSIDTVTPVEQYSTGIEDLDTDVPLHDRRGAIPDGSTESGQLLINKYKHTGTMLLSFYYNYNGPNYFYPLLGQGTSGEGDKDTFLAAATVLGESSYQVKKSPGTSGYHRDNAFHGVCMLQADPVLDYAIYRDIPVRTPTADFGFKKINSYMDNGVLFLHAHHPKLDPFEIFESGILIEGVDDAGKPQHARMYFDITNFDIGFDFELLQVVYMRQLVCEEDHSFKFRHFEKRSKQQYEKMCEMLDQHYDFLIRSTTQFGAL